MFKKAFRVFGFRLGKFGYENSRQFDAEPSNFRLRELNQTFIKYQRSKILEINQTEMFFCCEAKNFAFEISCIYRQLSSIFEYS